MAVVATALAACGSASPSAGPKDRVEAATGPSQSSAPAGAQWSADGASYGVDRTSWPGSLQDARTLLAALPAEMDGRAREYMPTLSDSEEGEGEQEGGEIAAVTYGQPDPLDEDQNLSVFVSNDTISPGLPPQVKGPQANLAAMFGLMYGCDMDTYEGTIERMPGGYPGPGMAAVDATSPAWFSCRIDGAEGAEDFTAQAVGWTSSKTAWLAIGPDDAALQELVTALHEAKG